MYPAPPATCKPCARFKLSTICPVRTACTSSTYAYNAEGERVQSVVNGAPENFLLGLGGEVETIVTNNGAQWTESEIQGLGRPLANYANATTYFRHADWLGTARLWSGVNGAAADTCLSLPFGDGSSCNRGAPSPLHFTGKYHDTETNLDYFGARYYSSAQGRFLTPDWSASPAAVPYANLANPQTLNLYAYAGNNPPTRFDPDGHCADHYKNGTCKVNVDPRAGEAGATAAKQLEVVLNKYDKAINALGDKSTFKITNSKGEVIGSLTGKEIKAVWNGTHFTVTDKKFNNGGAGGGTAGTWRGDSFSGQSQLNPGAVSAYANAASARAEAPLVGLSTLTFHELGHETHFGEALTQQYPVTPMISWPREQGASSAGSTMAGTVNAPFDCSIPGGCE